MSSLMIDIEGLATGPDATILTIAAQSFDPFGTGYYDRCYYARITLESQENRKHRRRHYTMVVNSERSTGRSIHGRRPCGSG
jgi:hypothetical protein